MAVNNKKVVITKQYAETAETMNFTIGSTLANSKGMRENMVYSCSVFKDEQFDQVSNLRVGDQV